jgi:hypothetical protein
MTMLIATAVPEQRTTYIYLQLLNLKKIYLHRLKNYKNTKNDFSPKFNKNDNPIDKKCQPGFLPGITISGFVFVRHDFVQTISES